MNRESCMNQFSRSTIRVALLFFLLTSLVVPCASAADAGSLTTTATVPPILMACAHATNPVAGFSCRFPGDPAAIIPDGPPYIIRCSDNSSAGSNQSVASWNWDFGDGGSSTDPNPWHTYSEASLYEIRLTVNTWCGSQYSSTTSESISTYCSVGEPAFTTNVTEGFAPLAVQVTDASKNTPESITRWTYWFDNSHGSHSRNPVFTFTVPGIYTINQTVWKDCVQISSKVPPPYERHIIVNSPPTRSYVTGITNTTPAAVLTQYPEAVVTQTAVESAPVPAEPSGAPVPGTESNRGSTTPAVTGPASIAPLPIIVLSLIVLGTIAMGIYLYRNMKKNP